MRTPYRLSLPIAIATFGIMPSQPLRAQDGRNEQCYLPRPFTWAMLKN